MILLGYEITVKKINKIKQRHEYVLPKAGEFWQLNGNIDDPFPSKDYPPVIILEVKEGWVRYSFRGIYFKDERHTVDDFIRMYHKVANHAYVDDRP